MCSCSFIKLSDASEKIFKIHKKFLCNPQNKNGFSSLSLCISFKLHSFLFTYKTYWLAV